MKRAIRIILTTCLVLIIGQGVSAQEYIVKSFELMPNDIDARVNSRVGNDGRKCALLKVFVQDGIDHVNGSVVGKVETKGIEKRIYMAHDSKMVELVFNNHFPLRIKFDDYNIPVLTEQTVYCLKLVEENSGANQGHNPANNRADNPPGNDQSVRPDVGRIDDDRIIAEADAAYDEGYYDKARNLYLKKSDVAYAANRLGYMYENGKGVAQNFEEAANWYRKSAEQGDADAQLKLGDMYANGHGLAKDYSEALRWYHRSAEQGDPQGQNKLGDMYEFGKGVAQDFDEAIRWYRKSAEQGDAQGQHNLGRMYKYGKGVQQDSDEAIRWYRRSAEQGNAESSRILGYMYENGQGVAQDYSEAIHWYSKSAAQGNQNAQRALERLKKYEKKINMLVKKKSR